MILFNEQEHINNLLNNGFQKYPNQRDLILLCKYWLDKGIDYCDLKDNMIEFCYRFNNKFNYPKNENLIMSVLEIMQSENLPKYFYDNNVTINTIILEEIKKIPDTEAQKIAFVILCLAKWKNNDYIYLNNSSTIKISEIFKLANIQCTKENQYKILNKLYLCGFLNIQLKPILKCFIPLLQNNYDICNEITFIIDNNLIQVWYDYIYPHCLCCGKGFEKKSNSQKYCRKCAIIIKQENRKTAL